MDYKNKIIDILEKLRQREQADKQPFKAKAYATVIKNLTASDKVINNIEDIKDIKGIGAKIYEKINEILETGKLKAVEDIDQKFAIMNDLSKIHGIGPAKAKDLVEKHDIKSIDDLKKHPELLNEKQLIGLKYWENFELRIPRAELDKHNAFLTEIIKKIDPKLKLVVVGSYRRGAKDSGDIDAIITHEDDPKDFENIIKNVVQYLNKEKYCKDEFALGQHKYLGVCKLKRHQKFRRLDLLYADKTVWPFSLLYFTGSKEFNVALRNVALSKNMSLSEYGLKHLTGPKKNKLVDKKFETEEDILNYLGYKNITPEQRKTNIKLEDYLL